MNKYIALTSILLVASIVFTLEQCSLGKQVSSWEGHPPTSWGKYRIDTVTNEVGLIRLYPELEHSECGLADDDFIKYTMKRIDFSRRFQFIVFIDGKPLVGERCLRKAFIFYLK